MILLDLRMTRILIAQWSYKPALANDCSIGFSRPADGRKKKSKKSEIMIRVRAARFNSLMSEV